MSEEPRARAGGRRRQTTRRLLRHPSRVAAKADKSAEVATVDVPEPEIAVVIESTAPDKPVSAVPNAAEPQERQSRDSLNITIEDEDDEDDESVDVEPSTTKLTRPAPHAKSSDGGVAETGGQATPSRSRSAGDSEIAVALEVVEEAAEAEAQTRPKIRLADSGSKPLSAAPRAQPARDETRGSLPAETLRAETSSSIPPRSVAAPSAPPRLSDRPSSPDVPRGEGIVRSSPPKGVADTDATAVDADNEVLTRPRIPLTQDMALAAGRITSQDVAPYRGGDDGPLQSRVPRSSASGHGSTEAAGPSVIVARAHVISDAPPANDRPASTLPRRSRRPRPESEEFEPLDLDDEETDEMSRLEVPVDVSIAPSASDSQQVRVSRTPPPPPAQGSSKRGSITGHQPINSQRAAPPPPPPASAPRKASASARKAGARKRAWWEVLFSDDYIRTLPRKAQSAIQKQVNFMEASLGIKRGDAVLDVGCGLGQHALELARRGYLVVALDLALSMITRAAEEAQQRGLRINFLHKDIRDIGFEGTFDAVICVGTTFGFFDDEQNRSVLMRLAHALKPGGRLLLDVVNRDFVMASQPNLVWFEGEGCVVMEESDFNFYSSRLHVKRTMMRDDGRQSDIEYNIRLYSVHELGQLLKQCGFVIREVSGQEATRGYFFGAQSARIVLLAERRPFTRTQGGDDGPPPNGGNGIEH